MGKKRNTRQNDEKPHIIQKKGKHGQIVYKTYTKDSTFSNQPIFHKRFGNQGQTLSSKVIPLTKFPVGCARPCRFTFKDVNDVSDCMAIDLLKHTTFNFDDFNDEVYDFFRVNYVKVTLKPVHNNEYKTSHTYANIHYHLDDGEMYMRDQQNIYPLFDGNYKYVRGVVPGEVPISVNGVLQAANDNQVAIEWIPQGGINDMLSKRLLNQRNVVVDPSSMNLADECTKYDIPQRLMVAGERGFIKQKFNKPISFTVKPGYNGWFGNEVNKIWKTNSDGHNFKHGQYFDPTAWGSWHAIRGRTIDRALLESVFPDKANLFFGFSNVVGYAEVEMSVEVDMSFMGGDIPIEDLSHRTALVNEEHRVPLTRIINRGDSSTDDFSKIVYDVIVQQQHNPLFAQTAGGNPSMYPPANPPNPPAGGGRSLTIPADTRTIGIDNAVDVDEVQVQQGVEYLEKDWKSAVVSKHSAYGIGLQNKETKFFDDDDFMKDYNNTDDVLLSTAPPDAVVEVPLPQYLGDIPVNPFRYEPIEADLDNVIRYVPQTNYILRSYEDLNRFVDRGGRRSFTMKVTSPHYVMDHESLYCWSIPYTKSDFKTSALKAMPVTIPFPERWTDAPTDEESEAYTNHIQNLKYVSLWYGTDRAQDGVYAYVNGTQAFMWHAINSVASTHPADGGSGTDANYHDEYANLASRTAYENTSGEKLYPFECSHFVQNQVMVPELNILRERIASNTTMKAMALAFEDYWRYDRVPVTDTSKSDRHLLRIMRLCPEIRDICSMVNDVGQEYWINTTFRPDDAYEWHFVSVDNQFTMFVHLIDEIRAYYLTDGDTLVQHTVNGKVVGTERDSTAYHYGGPHNGVRCTIHIVRNHNVNSLMYPEPLVDAYEIHHDVFYDGVNDRHIYSTRGADGVEIPRLFLNNVNRYDGAVTVFRTKDENHANHLLDFTHDLLYGSMGDAQPVDFAVLNTPSLRLKDANSAPLQPSVGVSSWLSKNWFNWKEVKNDFDRTREGLNHFLETWKAAEELYKSGKSAFGSILETFIGLGGMAWKAKKLAPLLLTR